MKIIYSIILSVLMISGCNGQTTLQDYIVKSDIPSKETEYRIEDGVIKLDNQIQDKEETLPNNGRVCIKAVYNEKTQKFEIIPCKQ